VGKVDQSQLGAVSIEGFFVPLLAGLSALEDEENAAAVEQENVVRFEPPSDLLQLLSKL